MHLVIYCQFSLDYLSNLFQIKLNILKFYSNLIKIPFLIILILKFTIILQLKLTLIDFKQMRH